MKKKLFFVAVLVVSTCLSAQVNNNPFAKYGYKKQIMYTSSKGEFEEFHDQADVVEIGSALFNTKTNQVIGFVSEKQENADVASATTAMSIDPLCEKYYWISPYAYALNNPVRNIDPTGKDVWEINNQGEIINRIKDKTQDAFYMVAKDADGNYQRTYTTDKDGNKNYNSISFEYGTVTSANEIKVKTDAGEQTMTMFGIKGDDKATQLFEFMANPGVTTNVEWSQDKIGTEKPEKNIVGTMRHESKSVQGYYLMNKGYTIREDNHSHPQGTGPSPADLTVAGKILEKNNKTLFNIYNSKTKKYIPYNANGVTSI